MLFTIRRTMDDEVVLVVDLSWDASRSGALRSSGVDSERMKREADLSSKNKKCNNKKCNNKKNFILLQIWLSSLKLVGHESCSKLSICVQFVLNTPVPSKIMVKIPKPPVSNNKS